MDPEENKTWTSDPNTETPRQYGAFGAAPGAWTCLWQDVLFVFGVVGGNPHRG